MTFHSKKRILFNTEATFLATGYGVLGRELISRLHSTGKYEIAELASYGEFNDPRAASIPWKYYGNVPPADSDERRIYDSNQVNQFGLWQFEKTCLDFCPDVVCSFRDNWYDKYEIYSPYRRYYNLVWMPTVDAEPQKEEWIYDLTNLDAVFTYTEWAYNLLKEQAGSKIKLIEATPPGADYNSFNIILNKDEIREKFGVNKDWLIVGMVNRNQKRKLYPQLIRDFARFLEEGPQHLTERAYLYLHTLWPDLGWDIPYLIKKYAISNRCLLTYSCGNPNCNAVYPSFFQDTRSFCKKCGQYTSSLVSSSNGVSNDYMRIIFNCFDVFAQYSNSEGLGLSGVEAVACGNTVMSVDYSGMSDIIKYAGATPIKVLSRELESETGCFRAVVDGKDFVNKLINILSLPKSIRSYNGFNNRLMAMKHFNYDKMAASWSAVIDRLEPKERWDGPSKIHIPPTEYPGDYNNNSFVKWLFYHGLNRPELADGYLAARMTRDLNWEYTHDKENGLFSDESIKNNKPIFKKFTKEDAVAQILEMNKINNSWEAARTQKFGRI